MGLIRGRGGLISIPKTFRGVVILIGHKPSPKESVIIRFGQMKDSATNMPKKEYEDLKKQYQYFMGYNPFTRLPDSIFPDK